ncbi:MAG: HpcH/HpaI aldolase/citrate lyase family protein [Pseudomonadota bacterium]|jgi:citrate lyase subunit beta/citryl-CoA lyase/(S)-citramalyl-CoA lyase
MRPRRSFLFVPGNRAEVHAKALAAGADTLCLDLEDAVPPQAKAEARGAAVEFLRAGPDAYSGPERVVRINTLRSAEGIRDLAAILDARPAAGVVFLPKVLDPGEVRLAGDLLAEEAPGLMLGVLIETAEGLQNVHGILAASDRIVFVMFGGVDLAADLGVAVAHEPLLYARSRVVHAGRRAGIDVLDVPCLAFRDEAAIRAEADAARALGFTGKALLHPAGIAPVHAAFSPSAEEIARAERIVAAYEASPNGLATVDGRLVERPVVRAMQKVLALRDAAQGGR